MRPKRDARRDRDRERERDRETAWPSGHLPGRHRLRQRGRPRPDHHRSATPAGEVRGGRSRGPVTPTTFLRRRETRSSLILGSAGWGEGVPSPSGRAGSPRQPCVARSCARRCPRPTWRAPGGPQRGAGEARLGETLTKHCKRTLESAPPDSQGRSPWAGALPGAGRRVRAVPSQL